jgi:hypothetical protein
MQVSHSLLVFTLRHISTHTSGTEFSSTVEKILKAEVAEVPTAWSFLMRLRAVFDASISRAEPRWRVCCWSYCWIIEGAPRWGDYSLVIFNPRFCVCPQDRLRHACFTHHHDHTLITYVWLLMTTRSLVVLFICSFGFYLFSPKP